MKIADISTHALDDTIDVRISDDAGVREETYRGVPGGYLWHLAKGPGGRTYLQVFRKPGPHEKSATGADGIAIGVPKASPNQKQRAVLLKAIAGHLKAKIVTLHSYVLMEGETEYETIKAESLEAALDEAEANVDSTNYEWSDESDRTSMFIEVSARHAKTGERASRTVILDPDPPKCSADDHAWEAPHALVGGLKENPGVVGSGGGVAFTKVCMRCGCGMHVDTWATDPTNGTGGHRTVRYVIDEFADRVA